MLRAWLLGRLVLQEPNGSVRNLPPGRPTELLGLLASRPKGLARAEASVTLWPDADEGTARQNLRQTLLALRALLGEGQAVVADRHTIALDPVRLSTDVGELHDALEAGLPDPHVPRGTLLPGIEAEWVQDERRLLSRRLADAALRAASALLPGDPSGTLAYAAIATEEEPLMEAPRSLRVRALLMLGDRKLAEWEVVRYDEARRELGLKPSRELRALLQTDAPSPEGSPAERLALATARAPGLLACGDVPEARAALEKALAECHSGAPSDLGAGRSALSLVLLHANDYEGAIASALEAKALADGPTGRGRALTALARARYGSGRSFQAFATAQRAAREADAAGDKATLAAALNVAAASRAAQGDHKAAEILLGQAVELAHGTSDGYLLARILHAQGHALTQTKGRDAAREAFERALVSLGETHHRHMAVLIRLDLGRLREEDGDAAGARIAYEDAATQARGLGDARSLTQALTYLGDMESYAGAYREASRHHAEAVTLRRVSGDRLGLATSLRGLGRANWGLGEDAVTPLSEAIGLYLACGDAVNLGRSRLLLAGVLEGAGREGAAANLLRKAIADLGVIQASSPGQDPVYTADAARELARRLGLPGINAGSPGERSLEEGF